MRSLRGRLTLGVAAVTAAVLAAAGLLISQYAERIAREALDDRLRRTAELSSATAVDAVANAIPDSDRRLEAVLEATDSSLRLVVGDAVILRSGERLLDGPAPPPGLRTIEREGERLRVLVVPLRRAGLGDLARLEAASSLGELEERQAALDRRLVLFGAIALLVATLGAYLASVRVLGPLRRLRVAARGVAAEEDLAVRVPERDGPAEVRELAASINEMLARLQQAGAARERALAATRRFALDAGHELRTPLTTVQASLSALRRHADMPAAQRAELVADALAEQRRLVQLLDGLQAYARGEASAAAHEDVDLAEIAADVAREHPDADVRLPDHPVPVRGWAPGLRLIVSNLVANALLHGGGAQVRLDGHTLTVDDRGPGIPPDQRERVFEPFARLDGAGGREGSGLGLALVAQQVREHGAEIAIGDAPGGGARFTVTFRRSPATAARAQAR
jgi:two-component system, OmpR family, sensor histidine kinase PrrB